MGTKTKGKYETENLHKLWFADRISALPDHIILHILLFLPTIVAVRMSILSKRWRYVWAYTHAMDFSYCTYFADDKRKIFYKFLGQYLDNRQKIAQHGTRVSINKFKLNIIHVPDIGALIDRWLSFVVPSNVKELDLHLYPDFVESYHLPNGILHARSLTSLKLETLNFEVLEPPLSVNLPSLKSLYLGTVGLDDGMLHSLILGCPSLENLILEGTLDSFNIRIASTSLKSFKVIEAYYNTIQVDAPNLQSFLYQQAHYSCVNIDLTACIRLKSLELCFLMLYEKWLEDTICGLPLLQSLMLFRCSSLRHIRIFSEHLKCFYLDNWISPFCRGCIEMDLMEATINTPNLISFSYNGHMLSKLSLNAPNLLEANINFCHKGYVPTYDLFWFTDLLYFLKEVDFSGSLNLEVPSSKALIVPEKMRKVCCTPLSSVKHLNVTALNSSESDSYLIRDSLLWCAPLAETLSIKHSEKK